MPSSPPSLKLFFLSFLHWDATGTQGIGRRQRPAAFQNEAEESDESEDETAGERTRTRVGRTRGGMKVADECAHLHAHVGCCIMHADV